MRNTTHNTTHDTHTHKDALITITPVAAAAIAA
jgi:hypothetical protein